VSDPFDGAGKPYRGASYRGLILVLVLSLLAISVLWILYGQVVHLVPPEARPT
jgi:hypothetical protein